MIDADVARAFADRERRERKNQSSVVRRVRGAMAPLRMRPGYLVIGAQKAGTTTLEHYLDRHPEIGGPYRKEVHYFDINAWRSPRWYLGHFPLKRSGGPRLAGEASPYYLFHPVAHERAHRLLPDVRLVVLLRDPVARAVSHYNHSRRRGLENLPLEEAVEREPERLAGEEERLRDPRALSGPHRHWSYVSRGRYAEQLERWLSVYPREQLHVVIAEEFFARPAEVYRDVLRFLGVSDVDPGEIEAQNVGTAFAPELDPATEARLRDAFRPHNERLAALIGRDPGWG